MRAILKPSKRLFCESGGPNNQVRPCSLVTTFRLLTLKQGRRSPASTRHRRGRRVESKGRIRSRTSHTKISLQGQFPASLCTIQCNNAGTHTSGQSREKFHQKYRPKIRQYSEGAAARWKGHERTANTKGDFG